MCSICSTDKYIIGPLEARVPYAATATHTATVTATTQACSHCMSAMTVNY